MGNVDPTNTDPLLADPGRPMSNKRMREGERMEIRKQTVRELKKLVKGCSNFSEFKTAVKDWDASVDLPE